MKLQPLHDKVFLRKLEESSLSSGGIIMPEEHRPVYSRGILLAMGLEAYDKLNDALVQVGDEVTIGVYAGRDREEAARKAGKPPSKVLECKAEDILGSVEAVKRVKDFALGLDDEGHTMYERKDK